MRTSERAELTEDFEKEIPSHVYAGHQFTWRRPRKEDFTYNNGTFFDAYTYMKAVEAFEFIELLLEKGVDRYAINTNRWEHSMRPLVDVAGKKFYRFSGYDLARALEHYRNRKIR